MQSKSSAVSTLEYPSVPVEAPLPDEGEKEVILPHDLKHAPGVEITGEKKRAAQIFDLQAVEAIRAQLDADRAKGLAPNPETLQTLGKEARRLEGKISNTSATRRKKEITEATIDVARTELQGLKELQKELVTIDQIRNLAGVDKHALVDSNLILQSPLFAQFQKITEQTERREAEEEENFATLKTRLSPVEIDEYSASPKDLPWTLRLRDGVKSVFLKDYVATKSLIPAWKKQSERAKFLEKKQKELASALVFWALIEEKGEKRDGIEANASSEAQELPDEDLTPISKPAPHLLEESTPSENRGRLAFNLATEAFQEFYQASDPNTQLEAEDHLKDMLYQEISAVSKEGKAVLQRTAHLESGTDMDPMLGTMAEIGLTMNRIKKPSARAEVLPAYRKKLAALSSPKRAFLEALSQAQAKQNAILTTTRAYHIAHPNETSEKGTEELRAAIERTLLKFPAEILADQEEVRNEARALKETIKDADQLIPLWLNAERTYPELTLARGAIVVNREAPQHEEERRKGEEEKNRKEELEQEKDRVALASLPEFAQKELKDLLPYAQNFAQTFNTLKDQPLLKSHEVLARIEASLQKTALVLSPLDASRALNTLFQAIQEHQSDRRIEAWKKLPADLQRSLPEKEFILFAPAIQEIIDGTLDLEKSRRANKGLVAVLPGNIISASKIVAQKYARFFRNIPSALPTIQRALREHFSLEAERY